VPGRIAVIGTGWADKVQIPAFQAGGLEVVAVAGRDPEKTQRVAQSHGVPLATTRWEELLELECELISITTPPHLHKPQLVAALEAGKHVLCEKPLALNAQDAEAMLAASDASSGQWVFIDHELRFTPARRKAKELLAHGSIGRIVSVTARVSGNARLDPDVPWNWWSDASKGGGILGAIGSHVFDGIRWLLEEHCGPIALHGAALGRVYPTRRTAAGEERDVSADDIVSASFSMGAAVGALFISGGSHGEPTDLLIISGTEGELVIDRSLKLYLAKRGGSLKEYVTHLPGIVPNRFRANPYAAGSVLLGEALADALERGSDEPLYEAATLRDGLAVQRLLDEVRALAGDA
jgi:predicted dehydrogenase